MMTERMQDEINRIGPLKPHATREDAVAWVRAMDRTSGGPMCWDDIICDDLPVGCPDWVYESAKLADEITGSIWDAVESNWEAEYE